MRPGDFPLKQQKLKRKARIVKVKGTPELVEARHERERE